MASALPQGETAIAEGKVVAGLVYDWSESFQSRIIDQELCAVLVWSIASRH